MLSGMPPSSPPTVFNPLVSSFLYKRPSPLFRTDLQTRPDNAGGWHVSLLLSDV